jgi:hypothetical protein
MKYSRFPDKTPLDSWHGVINGSLIDADAYRSQELFDGGEALH